MIGKGLVEKVLTEKTEAVALWKEIEALGHSTECPDAKMEEFIEVSCTYGRIKYEIVEKAWTVMLLGKVGDENGNYDTKRMKQAIAEYDALWDEWKTLKKNNPLCPTLYYGNYGSYDVNAIPPVTQVDGMDHSVNRYRKLVKLNAKQPKSKLIHQLCW